MSELYGGIRVWMIWLVVCVMLGETFLPAQETEKKSKTVSFDDSGEAPVVAAASVAGRRTLSDREARRLGITFRSVREALKDLKASKEIDGTESNAELSVIVADHISSKNEYKGLYAGPAAVDWDALLAFLEKLIALILKLFAN